MTTRDAASTPSFVARTTAVAVAVMAMLWLVAAVVLYSDAGSPIVTIPWFLLWFAGMVLIPVTVAAVIVVAVAHRKTKQTWAWPGALAPPAAFIFWVALVATDTPFEVRFLLSKGELEDFAHEHVEGDRNSSYNKRVGLFSVEEYDVVEGCTRFITSGDLFDDAGLAFCPAGNRPPRIGEDSYQRLFGDWWHWHRSW